MSNKETLSFLESKKDQLYAGFRDMEDVLQQIAEGKVPMDHPGVAEITRSMAYTIIVELQCQKLQTKIAENLEDK